MVTLCVSATCPRTRAHVVHRDRAEHHVDACAEPCPDAASSNPFARACAEAARFHDARKRASVVAPAAIDRGPVRARATRAWRNAAAAHAARSGIDAHAAEVERAAATAA